jgi:hypothetical protein
MKKNTEKAIAQKYNSSSNPLVKANKESNS